MANESPKNYEIHGSFIVTHNPKERTYGIYTKSKEFLEVVDEGELNSTLDALEKRSLERTK